MRVTRSAAVLAGLSLLASSAIGIPNAGAKTKPIGAHVTMALNQTLAGWNVQTSSANQFVLAEILNQVWPSPFIVNNNAALVRDANIVSSASATTVGGRQVLTYVINPKAVWSDGVKLTADDFIYTYQANSGDSSFKDKGNKTYDSAGTTGYNQIESVVGSGVSAKKCGGSAADRTKGLCPNGTTVTVTMLAGKPFPDWKTLFGLVPAHVARKVGFNTGFNANPVKTVVSAGPYIIKSYDAANNNVIETVNPKWWGAKPKTPTIVFQNLKDDTQGVAGVAIGDYNVFQPVSTSLSMQQQAATQPSVDYSLVPGLQFEHLDFNEQNPDLAKRLVRRAIALGTDRPGIIAATVGQVVPSTKPLGNRMFVPGQDGYVDNGAGYNVVHVQAAKDDLDAAGYFYNSGDGYYHSGSSSGPVLTFEMYSTTAAIRGQTMQLFQAQMKDIGIKINIHQQAGSKLFGDTLPNQKYDIIEFAWVASVAVSANQAIYCSYTNTADCSSNNINYANPAVDNLLFQGAKETTDTAEAADYNAADQILWTDMATLPLYQKPVFVAYTTGMKSVLANPTSAGITWNAQNWSL